MHIGVGTYPRDRATSRALKIGGSAEANRPGIAVGGALAGPLLSAARQDHPHPIHLQEYKLGFFVVAICTAMS